eukprot:c10050_g1_i1.p1 GENE.c10050_g1_i1~~c10050_g1_i1.p1  ORF type:complete len:2035 (+),score=454.83 c10050_g1_i1:41-6106(+)
MRAALVLVVVCAAQASAELLMNYIGFGHAVVFDKASSKVAGYDFRESPASSQCDILHFPPVAPPTALGDHIALKHPTNLRLFRFYGEMFVLMDGDSGSFTTYECQGFRPFLPAMPCKVHGVGESSMFAGNVHLTYAGPTRLLAYNSADGSISVHFADIEVTTSQSISKTPIGKLEKKLATNLPHVAGEASLAVLLDLHALVVLHKATRSVKIFRYNWNAEEVSGLLGDLIQESSSLLPEWAQEIFATDNGRLIAYNPQTAQYVMLTVSVNSGALSFQLSSVQHFHSETSGFVGGHACLFDDRNECLGHEGCGWCVTSQRCLHMGDSKACDESCAHWCAVDSLGCMEADQLVIKALGPQNKTFDPNLVSPKDVNSGAVVAGGVLFPPDIDHQQVISGVAFESPEKSSSGCMNAGFNDPLSVDNNKGCNDNDDKQTARVATLASMDQMNDYRGSLTTQHHTFVDMPAQSPPSNDCSEVNADGTRLDFNNDAPVSSGEGTVPVAVTDKVVNPRDFIGTVENKAQESDLRRSSSKYVTGDATMPLTDRRFKRIQKKLQAEDRFLPPQAPTISVHEMMNGKKNTFTFLGASGDRLNSGHATDESRLTENFVLNEKFSPQQGEPKLLKTSLGVFGSLVLTFSGEIGSQHNIERAVALSLAVGAGVNLNNVQLYRVTHRVGEIQVEYTISGEQAEAEQHRLWSAFTTGEFESQLKASGLFSDVKIVYDQPTVTSHVPTNFATTGVTTEDMESGCGEDGLEPNQSASNFMNGVALSPSHVADDDGQHVQGLLTGTFTEKQLQSFSTGKLVELLKQHSITIPQDVTQDKAIALLRGVVSPAVTRDNQAQAFRNGMKLQTLDGEIDFGPEWMPIATKFDVVTVDNHVAPPEATAAAPKLQDTEASTTVDFPIAHAPAVNVKSPIRLPASVSAVHPSTQLSETRPEQPLAGDIGVGPDGSIYPISMKEAKNPSGLPVAVDPLNSIIENPFPATTNELPDGSIVQIRDPNLPSNSVIAKTLSGSLQANIELGEGSTQIPTEFVFTRRQTTERTVIGVEVDPLVEYRDTEEDVQDSLDSGCISTEDPYTGNSQPRIDYIGNDLMMHVQPMMSTWGVYNVSSGAVVASGVLPSPFHPTRRSALGGRDNRFLEHYPITGAFKLIRCKSGVFSECQEYAQGQWDTTIHTNDVFLALNGHEVLCYNIDKGSWRIFNFDRDVSGSSDPFSTALPPISAGTFPGFEDDELVYLGNGLLMAHDPPTGNTKFYRFDSVRKTLLGPTHEGNLGDSGQRVTGLSDGRVIIYRPQMQSYRVYKCEEDAVQGDVKCSFTAQQYLHASSRFDANPVLRQLLASTRRTCPLSFSSDSASLFFLEKGTVNRVAATVADLDGIPKLPTVEFFGIASNVKTVVTRPQYPDHVVVVLGDDDHTDVKDQLAIVTSTETKAITNDHTMNHILGSISSDGTFLSYLAIPNSLNPDGSIGIVLVYIVELSAVLNGKGVPTLIRSYPSSVTLGPFSQDSRYLLVQIDSSIPQDNNLELVDILSGQTRLLTPTADAQQREPSQWILSAGAVFHGRNVYVVSNENVNYFGLQRINIDHPAEREWILDLGEDITSVSFNDAFTRLAVTSINKNLRGEFRVYALRPLLKSVLAVELKSPYIIHLEAEPCPLLVSPDGTKLAFTKETGLEPGQVYIAEIKQPQAHPPAAVVQTSNITTPPAPRNLTRATEELPIVSVASKLTGAVISVPNLITNLPLPEFVTFNSFDGLPIQAFHFPPSLTPLYQKIHVPHNSTINSTLFANINTTSLSRLPPYIIYVHGGPKLAAPTTLWNLPAFNFLRSLGIGILVPNIRGSLGNGKRYSLMGLQQKRFDAIEDLKAAHDYICSLPNADCNNIAIAGASYGGFAALSAATRFPSLWKFVVEIAGISNFETFLKTTLPPTRRADRAREYGLDSAWLRELSPVTHARNLTAPLLVVHGANDVTVPPAQAEEIVAAARANHGVVQYLALHGEGHKAKGEGSKVLFASTVVHFALKHFGMLVEQ